MSDRQILRVEGKDAANFLQGLVTNDVAKLETGALIYAALLTAQGKYIADFFMLGDGDDILIDVAAELAAPLAQRLTLYKLRADVAIIMDELHVHRGLGAAPADAHADPRDPAMGWRAYRHDAPAQNDIDWDALRVAHAIPETGIELTPDQFIMEMGFERIQGVDFRKGCYVGQEVTARMKHKTELRKGLARVRVSGDADSGTPIENAGKAAGRLLTRSGDFALAYLRFDRATGVMQAGDAAVEYIAD